MSRIFSWYTNKLATNPTATNIISTATLFGIGDVVAQNVVPSADGKFDWQRCGRAVTYGGLIFGPIGNKWYPLISKIQGSTPMTAAVKRTVTDQGIFSPFIGVPMYFTCMGLMEGKRGDDLKNHLQKNYLPTLLVNWSVWPAVQFVNFMFVPVQLRLLTVNVVSIAWNTFLSMKNANADPL